MLPLAAGSANAWITLNVELGRGVELELNDDDDDDSTLSSLDFALVVVLLAALFACTFGRMILTTTYAITPPMTSRRRTRIKQQILRFFRADLADTTAFVISWFLRNKDGSASS